MPSVVRGWYDLLNLAAQRAREGEIALSYLPPIEYGVPYWMIEEVEEWLLEASQRAVRSVPAGYLDQLGSAAITVSVLSSGDTIPLNIVGILSATIRPTSGTAEWLPAQQVTVPEWYQQNEVTTAESLFYVFKEGKVFFKGQTIRLTLVKEPPIDDWQSDAEILPASEFDEPRLDFVHQMLQVTDYLPIGML